MIPELVITISGIRNGRGSPLMAFFEPRRRRVFIRCAIHRDGFNLPRIVSL